MIVGKDGFPADWFRDLPDRKPWWANYWPTIVDEQSAIDGARLGSTAAFWVAGATAVFAMLATVGVFAFLTPLAVIDAAMFCGLALAIRKKLSRVAAVSALLLYVLEIATTLANPQPARSFGAVGIVTIILIVCFVNGVRGTFAARRYRATA